MTRKPHKDTQIMLIDQDGVHHIIAPIEHYHYDAEHNVLTVYGERKAAHAIIRTFIAPRYFAITREF